MTKAWKALTVCIVAVLCSNVLMGQSICSTASCGNYIGGTPTPFAEFITHDNIQISGDGNWYDVGAIAAPCIANGTPNIQSTQAFSLAMRGHLEFETASVAVGSRYETQLTLHQGATEYSGGWHARTIRSIQYNGTSGPPITGQNQGDWFHGILTNMDAGNYTFSLKVRLFGGGTMTFHTIYLTALGSPTANGAGYFADGTAVTVGGSWTKIGEITVNNQSGSPVSMPVQGYFEIVSGTVGDRVSIGFGIDYGSSGTHSPDVYVPAELPTGQHVRDVFPNDFVGPFPTGSHTIQMWAKNQNGHTTTLENRELGAVGYTQLYQNLYTVNYTPIIASTTTTETQPQACFLRDYYVGGLSLSQCAAHPPNCGNWTKLLTLNVPEPDQGDLVPFVDGYIEFLGHSGNWGSSMGQIAIEVILSTPDAGLEFGQTSFDIPAGTRHLSFHGDAMLIGMHGATVNLWYRKMTCGGDPAPASETIGKRYLGLQTIALQNYCYKQ